MQATQARYRAASVKVFRNMLAAWLDTLPPAGWEGTVFDLQAAIEGVNAKHWQYGCVPRGNALGVRIRAEEPFLEAQGFAISFHRSATVRTLRLVRA